MTLAVIANGFLISFVLVAIVSLLAGAIRTSGRDPAWGRFERRRVRHTRFRMSQI